MEKYLRRIKISNKLEPSLEVLCALQKAHLLNVPFENLDIHYGRSIDLDIHRIFEKVVVNHRGGFCYELNGLFYELLLSLGFDAQIVSARVFDNERGFGAEFDHLAVVVKLEGLDYLADVGFGEFTFSALKIELNKIQNDARGEFVIDKYDEAYFRVNKIAKGQPVPVYIFKNIERKFDEFSGMCRFHQTSSESHFTKKRLISIPTEEGRITISGDLVIIKEKDMVKEIPINSEAEFNDKLWKYFRIKLAG